MKDNNYTKIDVVLFGSEIPSTANLLTVEQFEEMQENLSYLCTDFFAECEVYEDKYTWVLYAVNCADDIAVL